MTKYVVYDDNEKGYVQTIYRNSCNVSRDRGDAIEVDTVEDAKAMLSIARARSVNTHKLSIRVTETTETEFDPDAPHIK